MRGLKAASASILVLFLSFSSVSKTMSESRYSAVTKDSKVFQALDLMNGTSAEWAKNAILGNNVSKRPMIIKFRNLAEISQSVANFDALGWKEGEQLYIFINQKHSDAPPAAIASLLSHEAVHQDSYCSLEEETYAWGYEADVWIQMVKRTPEVASIDCPLTQRLNTLSRLFKSANFTTNNIRSVVYSNPGYKGLPTHSPGF
jgi:hypothetical protein